MPQIRPAQAQIDQFNKTFNLDFNDYWEGLVLHLDICKFAKALWPKFYEEEGSLRNFIIEKYGQEACDLVESLL